MRIGMISDTHMPERWPNLPQTVFDIFNDVDLILHAGDVGELWVLDALSAAAPVAAVHGNDETAEAQRGLPDMLTVSAGGRRIAVWHSHIPEHGAEMAFRTIDGWGPKLDRHVYFARRVGASVVVYGHTHVPMAVEHQGVLIVNPGALAGGGISKRQKHQTVAILEGGEVTFYDLADGTVFDTRLDLDAGFAAAARRYEESILDEEVQALWPGLMRLARRAPEPSRAALLPVAHRVWAGQQPLITRADLLAVLGDLPPDIAAEADALLKG